MSKRKNIFNLSIFGLASLGLITGGNFLITGNHNVENISTYADTTATISNSAPEYFSATYDSKDLIANETPLVLYESDKNLNLKFNTTSETKNTKTFYVYNYENDLDKEWTAFNFNAISIKHDGEVIEGLTDNKKYITSAEATDLDFFGLTTTEAFDLDIKLGDSNAFSGKILSLAEEGLYEITIPYIEYNTIDNGNSFDTISKSVTYTFMLFDHDTYLGTNTDYPIVSYDDTFVREVSSELSIYDYSYYYHYNKNTQPWISYDYTKYDLSITKDINLSESTSTIIYNNSTNEFVGLDESIAKYAIDETNNLLYIYFFDIGSYTLDFDLVYTTPTYQKYYLTKDVNKQIIYMYGYQSTYTAYDKANNKNIYKEFKETERENYTTYNITASADVTSKVSSTSVVGLTGIEFNEANVKPVSTNQVPVKFNEYGTLSKAYLYEVNESSTSESKTTLTFDEDKKTAINASKNISTSGTYFVAFEYSFNNYILNGASKPGDYFYQYFYFTIDNSTPIIDVLTDTISSSTEDVTTYSFTSDKKDLSSGEYTNKNVYLSAYETGKFDSEVIIKIKKYDFTNNSTSTKNIDKYTKLNISDKNYYEFTENGNYIIYLYYGRLGESGTPITRRFNIDKTNISDVKAYGVSQSGATYKTTSQIDTLTNEPMIFTWETKKASGASTYGYYKYYPIESSVLETNASSISSMLLQFTGNTNSVPIDYKLNLNVSASWISYTNARNIQNSSTISSSYVRSGAGLYILAIYDEAGNMTSEVYMLDNTSPKFVINEPTAEGLGNYSYMTGSTTLSRDATIIWSKYKSIKISDEADEYLCEDINSEINAKITEKYNSFITQYSQLINAVSSAYVGKYLMVPINDEVLFKDLTAAESGFKFITNTTQYNIISSYSLYVVDKGNNVFEYYFTSTTPYYIKVSDPSVENAILNGTRIHESSISGTLKEYDNQDGKGYQSIYNREGSYQFLIRDVSNTKGYNSTERNKYLNYSSAYQVVNLTSDASLTTIGYKQNSKLTALKQADNASYVLDDTKYAYYQPSSIDEKLYVSFIPSFKNGDTLVHQLDYVEIKYYPFVDMLASNFKNGQTFINYYRAISDTATINHKVYEYKNSTNISTETLYFELNTVNNKTAEGLYVITRVYKDTDGLTIDKYDYKTRVLTLIVDRENVISEPDVVNGAEKTYNFSLDSSNYEFITTGKTLLSSYLGTFTDDFYVSINGNKYTGSSDRNTEKDGKSYKIYEFNDEITSLKLFKKVGSAPAEITDVAITYYTAQSTESITGSGVLTSMFSGSDLMISIPNYMNSDSGLSAINSGYTFYTTAQSFTDYLVSSTRPSTVFTTNKIPFTISVPQYKYTIQYTKNEEGNSYSISNNNQLSFFHTNVSIEYNELHVDVYKIIGKDNKTLVASTDGTADNGYLKFHDSSGEEIKEFTTAGQYVVVITQAYDSVYDSQADYKGYKNTYIYSFDVEETSPEFTLYGKDGKKLKGPNDEEIFYTNQDEVIVKWTDNASEFTANIDKSKIKIDGKVYSIVYSSDGYKLYYEETEITWAEYSYNETTLDNTLTIKLTEYCPEGSESIYKNGNSFSISMILTCPEGSKYYNYLTKNINIDTTIYEIYSDANKTSIEELFARCENLDSSITAQSLREFYDVNGISTTDYTKISYSTTVSTGIYKYYAFAVNSDYINTLKNKVSTNKALYDTAVTSVYIKPCDSDIIYTDSFTETSYSNFFESGYTSIESTEFSFEAGKYYEIVESDYAGNLLIYLVYCTNTVDNAITYSISETEGTKNVSDAEVESSKYNIYTNNLSSQITNFNLHGDKWLYVMVEQNGISTKYLTTPWEGSNLIILTTKEAISYSSLLSTRASDSKTKIYISDRVNGNYYLVQFGKSITSSLIIDTLSFGETGLTINVPSDNVQTSNKLLTFPVKIVINSGSDPFTATNDPNEYVTIADYNYQTGWISSGNWIFTYDATSNKLKLTYNGTFADNTKLKYTITDNFGKETTFISIVGASYSDKYSWTGYLYQSYEGDKLYYRTQNSFTYEYNNLVYLVKVKNNDGTDPSSDGDYFTTDDNKLIFTCKGQCDKKYEIEVRDAEDESLIKTYYIHLYNMLPLIGSTYGKSVNFIDENANNLNEDFSTSNLNVNLLDKDYRVSKAAAVFANIITINYDTPPTNIPYQAYLLKDDGKEFVAIPSGYKIAESGLYYLLFKYTTTDIFTNEYVLYKLEVLDASSNFYYVTVDGTIVKAQQTYYKDKTAKEYSNYYIVNVAYNNKSRVEIVCNEYQKITCKFQNIDSKSGTENVVSAIYLVTNQVGSTYPIGTSPYNDYVVITYIAPTSSPVSLIKYTTSTGSEENLTYGSVITAEKGSDYNQLKIRWNKYYGIEQNLISILAVKDGYNYTLPIYYEENFAYTYLTISGSYRLRFKDAAGNIQKFGDLDYVDVTFLKDVHFTMITTTIDEEGNEIEHETEAIDRVVFNSAVKLKIKNLSKYYTTSSVGAGNAMIKITRNGEEYTGYTYNSNNATFTISQIGLYQVYFSASALSNGLELREQVYTFAIINPNEARYAYEFSAFENYTIEKAIQDTGISIVDQSNKFTNDLLVSYYDTNTGLGAWTITINTHKKLTPGSDEDTKFTFTFLIRTAVPPIDISIKDGESTTSEINITFNAENVYNTVGDCIIICGKDSIEINSTNYTELGVVKLTITNAGTYYIQVVTESGRLLYSYKVIKTDPLNTWAIIAIVVGSIAVIVVLIIVIKLRKRINVK